MINALKRTAARLPVRMQQELKRLHFARQIKASRFVTDEPEYHRLAELVGAGDWVLDIGANIGHYTARASSLVGAEGRVIAFEPVPETFELLAANVARCPLRNITLINAAASNQASVASMDIPTFAETGLDNFYMAHLSASGTGLRVMCLTVDALALPHPVKLVKIDAEGHERPVLEGMRDLLVRDRPVLIVEDNDPSIEGWLAPFGYAAAKLPGSSNRVFRA